MNPSPQSIVSEALKKGWVSVNPVPVMSSNYLKYDMPYRQRLYAAGLTARGTVRKRRPKINPAIIAQARRDGVGVTAIYNRIERHDTMRPSMHGNSKSGTK